MQLNHNVTISRTETRTGLTLTSIIFHHFQLTGNPLISLLVRRVQQLHLHAITDALSQQHAMNSDITNMLSHSLTYLLTYQRP